ncbi:PucR family transcriptional regulator [Streptomyces sp. NBC_01477]|uniref:PucR family transcriptional regulator n=1 Tax=Streptomyces sp. NBC_01477 TaxID=2976015 RepID=UPI002E34C853|nr:helix-turn-helix domain-containing protein [Streptomyces sp. NBC_01477]
MADTEIPREFLDGYTRILATVTTTGRRLTREELLSQRALGARAAVAGYGWRVLVREHLAAERITFPAAAAPDTVLAAAAQAFDAFAEGYEREQRLVVRREEAARRAFIEDLLHSPGDLGHLAERAERFGLRMSRSYAVAVAEGPDLHEAADPRPRAVESDLFARFERRRVLFTTHQGRMVCIAPGDQDDVLAYFAARAHAAADGARAVISRPRPGLGGIVHSYEEALSALDVAQRIGIAEPLLRASDMLVYTVVLRDRQALVDLVHATFGPLLQARGGARPYIDTLAAYFGTGCVAAETARRLSLSVRALTYRLGRIHTLTGFSPVDPQHRYTLQTATLGARLLGWPAPEPAPATG